MIKFQRKRKQAGDGSVVSYLIEESRSSGSVNGRTCRLWRKDSRYPGHVSTYRDTESGGVVLEFDALRHGAKEPRLREVIDPSDVDKLILSLLEVRAGEWADGPSETEEAARTLVAFMCCQAGLDFVDREVLRPFGYSLEPGPVVRSNSNLSDALEQIEIQLRDLAGDQRDGRATVPDTIRSLERIADYARRQIEQNPPQGA